MIWLDVLIQLVVAVINLHSEQGQLNLFVTAKKIKVYWKSCKLNTNAKKKCGCSPLMMNMNSCIWYVGAVSSTAELNKSYMIIE